MPEETRRGYKIQVIPKAGAGAQGFAAAGAEPGHQTLLIDGKETPYRKTPKGYSIYFTPPAPDLMEAARRYIDTQREK